MQGCPHWQVQEKCLVVYHLALRLPQVSDFRESGWDGTKHHAVPEGTTTDRVGNYGRDPTPHLTRCCIHRPAVRPSVRQRNRLAETEHLGCVRLRSSTSFPAMQQRALVFSIRKTPTLYTIFWDHIGSMPCHNRLAGFADGHCSCRFIAI